MRRPPVPAEAMTGSPPPAAEAVAPATGAALARARRVRRRCGARRADRGALAAELAGEVEAAAADGHPPESVLGEDVEATARLGARARPGGPIPADGHDALGGGRQGPAGVEHRHRERAGVLLR